MISCTFDDGGKGLLRHITTDVIVLNHEQSAFLLVRRSAKVIEAHKLCLPGGYLSRDETLAEGAAREVLEETGYKVTNLQLFLINDYPGRPNDNARQNVPNIFIGEVGEKVSDPDHETDEVHWCPLNDIPAEDEIAFDHYKVIQEYLEYRKHPFHIPILKALR